MQLIPFPCASLRRCGVKSPEKRQIKGRVKCSSARNLFSRLWHSVTEGREPRGSTLSSQNTLSMSWLKSVPVSSYPWLCWVLLLPTSSGVNPGCGRQGQDWSFSPSLLDFWQHLLWTTVMSTPESFACAVPAAVGDPSTPLGLDNSYSSSFLRWNLVSLRSPSPMGQTR